MLRKVVLSRDPPYPTSGSLTPIQTPRAPSVVNPQVLDALYAIQSTPYENAFLSRIQGFQPSQQIGVIAVDWETRTPWMELMCDIRDHYALAQYASRHCDLHAAHIHRLLLSPEREQPQEAVAPITYRTLQRCHLAQVHDLLARVFWEGIDGAPFTPTNSYLLLRIFECSQRFARLLSREVHHRCNVQAARRRSRLPELPTRDIHHVPRCPLRLGQLPNSNVSHNSDH